MSFYRSIILFFVLLLWSLCSGAQDNNYVYKDTAIFYADSIEAKAMEVAPAEKEEQKDEDDFITDTLLTGNQLFIERDSIKALKKLESFGYAKNLDSLLVEYQRKQETDSSIVKIIPWLAQILFSPVTKYLLWALAVFFVSYLLYKLFFTEGFFQVPFAKTNVAVLPGDGDELTNKTDFEKLIGQASGAGNYRLAVRYHYLQSLQRLSSKGVIQFARDKTNRQYLAEMSGKAYKKAFASLTLYYEYVWYGEFSIDEAAFKAVQHKFQQFNSEV